MTCSEKAAYILYRDPVQPHMCGNLQSHLIYSIQHHNMIVLIYSIQHHKLLQCFKLVGTRPKEVSTTALA